MSLEEIANYIVSDGKGILAADESNPTCGKRFDSIEVENSENNRRDYREMLFRSKGMKGNIGGVILFDETLRQDAKDGTPLRELISNSGALPGIKVDKGLVPLVDGSDEGSGGECGHGNGLRSRRIGRSGKPSLHAQLRIRHAVDLRHAGHLYRRAGEVAGAGQ